MPKTEKKSSTLKKLTFQKKYRQKIRESTTWFQIITKTAGEIKQAKEMGEWC